MFPTLSRTTNPPRGRPADTELIRLQAINARLEAVLAKVFEEVREFPDSPPESSDSYLPPHLVVEIAEALHYARAR